MRSSLKIFKDFDFFKEINQGLLSIWGDFGTGKTTLAIQLLLRNTYVNYKSIYIYTKPNFPFRRLYKIFENDIEKISSNILLIQSTNFDDLYQLVFNLEFIILKNRKHNEKLIKLIVIDSLTDLYRLELDHEKKDKNFILNYRLNTILGNLAHLNNQYGIDIAIVNELSKKSIDGELSEVESGGNVMDYWIQNSIKIERLDTLNYRNLVFINKIRDKTVKSKINFTANGFIS